MISAGYKSAYQQGYSDAMRDFRKEPKTGHWIYKQYDGYPECGNWHCSECDEIDNRTSAYCPYCGTKMIEPQEGSDKA